MRVITQIYTAAAGVITVLASLAGLVLWSHADLKSDITRVETSLKADIAENRKAINDLRIELKADIAENKDAINENKHAIVRLGEILEGIKETLTSTVERLDLVEAKQDDHSGRIIRLETKLEKSR